MNLFKRTYYYVIVGALLVIVQFSMFYVTTQHRYIYNLKKERQDDQTTISKHIEYSFEYVNQSRKLFPKFGLDDVEPYWRKHALLYQTPVKLKTRYLTMGMVTAKRPHSTIYLYKTLDSLLSNLSEEDKEDIYIVILLADPDDDWRKNVTDTLHTKYSTEIKNGTIQLLRSFPWMYPKLEKLTHHYIGHSSAKVRWKSKQNIDFAFLWLYVYKENTSKYYLHLEDDVITIPDYLKQIKDYVNGIGRRWTCLEFSVLGMIAKLYHTLDLNKLAQMVALFYEEQPADVTFIYFNNQMLQSRRIIRKPTLFQHMGRNSSLTGKIMLVKDRFFPVDTYRKSLKGDNPPAKLETSLKIKEGFPPENAYNQGFGHFWSDDRPKPGDYFKVKFKSPQRIRRIVVLSGMKEFPKDFFHNAVLETSATINETTKQCINYQTLWKFINGTVDMQTAIDKYNTTLVHCVQIRVLKRQPFWVIITEMAIFLWS